MRNYQRGTRQLEIVSDCTPFASCELALRWHFGSRFILHGKLREQAASVLGLHDENALRLYDIVRCARCARLSAAGASAQSSFFQVIDLLHARWHGGANVYHAAVWEPD